jgi:CHAT domain-containing protein/Tfp pilus assembly protein PilF
MADHRPAWFVLSLMLATAAAAQDSRTSSPQDQLSQHEQKLSQARAARNLKEETSELVSLGSLQLQAGDTQKAEDSFNQALQIWRKVGNRNGEALALNDIGRAYGDLRRPQKALEVFNQALPLWREAGNRRGEALTLNNMGRVYSDLGQEQQALELFNQALPIWREAGNHHGEASTLNAMGRVYSDMGQEQKALELFNQALPYWREAADRNGEALTLDNLGRVYAGLGQSQKALDFYNQALPIWRTTGNRHGEASTLNSIGRVYADMGKLQSGLEFYNQALPAWRDVGDRSGVALTLNNIGRVYADQGQKQKALELYYQALPIWREVENPRGEAGTLTNIGLVYDNQAQPEKVLPNELAALSLAKSARDLDLQGRIEASLMRYFRGQRRPEVAIFFGTAAVNSFQQMRRNISGLDKDLQSGFAQSKSTTYRQLAELLVQTDRLGEAEQVLDLLKEQELKEVVRGASGNPTGKAIALTPEQQKAQSELDSPEKAAVTLTALNMEYAELQAKTSRTPAEEARLKELDARIEAGNGEVSAFFRNTLYTQLAHKVGTEDANALLSREKSDVSQLQNTLAELGPRVLGIRLLLGEEHAYAIVVTAHSREKVELKATPAELRSNVLQVRDDLRTPSSDPKPHLAQLYAMVVAPLAPQLAAVEGGQDRVPTLIWSLDGVLRYVPMAALYDGKHYMAERFNNVLFTPESYGHMTATSSPGLRVLAMGLSKSYGGLPALPGVMPELEAVVRDPAVPQSHGPMDGKLLPDEQFTLAALKTQLGGGFPVVHIASHFVVESGSGEEPYLMLGGENVGGAEGYALTLSKMEDSTISFRGTQLLTLSACSTAKGDAAKDGLEMDSLGMIAQQKDAAAVLATLWDVNDASTSRLMSDFYARWVKLPAGGKAEALRQAQLAFLHGSSLPNSRGDRGSKMEQEPNAASYAHPFYWAPFVLIGNFQ